MKALRPANLAKAANDAQKPMLFALCYGAPTGRCVFKAACTRRRNHWTRTLKLWEAQLSIFQLGDLGQVPHHPMGISDFSSVLGCRTSASCTLEEGVCVHPLAPTSSSIQLSIQNCTSMNATDFGRAFSSFLGPLEREKRVPSIVSLYSLYVSF